MKDFNNYLEVMEKCSHCALCEATCPVFLEDLLETHVARSRVELIRAVMIDEKMDATKRFKDIVNRCLLCTNCKQTCPANVPVDDIVITARHLLYNGKRMNMVKRKLLKQVMENRGIKGAMGKLGNIAKIVGIKDIPEIPPESFDDKYKSGSYQPEGEKRVRVAYYAGCATNTMFPETGDAVMKVLAKNNIEVVIPKGLVCCGIPALGEGDLKTAREMVRKNIATLSEIDVDIIVTDCTSCGMTFKEKTANLLEDDDPLKEKAVEVAGKFREITEYLVEIGLTEKPSSLKERYTYHVPCHRGWTPELADGPRELLSQIPDAEMVEMENPENCCGAGGTFFLEYKDLASSIRSKKKDEILETKADILITQCPSCRSYIKNGVGDEVKVMHPVTMLAKAYGL